MRLLAFLSKMVDVDHSIERLGELLRHPDDLDKIAALKAEFTRKKGAVDAQLKAGLKDQLEVTQSGMGAIADSQRIVNQIKEEMMAIDKLCAESQIMIKEFPNLSAISVVHRNFAQVEVMKSNIDGFDGKLSDLQTMLDKDENDLENQPNLLDAHRKLTALRDMRDEAMDQAKQTTDDALERELEDYFGRLDDVVSLFDEHFGLACLNLIHFVQTDNTKMVKKLAYVIEKEEQNDAKVKAMQDATKDHKELAAQFKSLKSGPKQLRGYKDKFLQSIEAAAKGKLDESEEMFLENPEKLDKATRWFFNDLMAVKQGMVGLMPAKWDIFKTYTDIFHKMMHDWLLGMIDGDKITSKQILNIITYREKYYSKMNKFGWTKDDLKPDLLDDREGELVREWRQLIVNKVEEWIQRMYHTDEKDFINRNEDALDRDTRGYFQTKTQGDMWRMLKEQADVAADSGRQDVIDGVVDEMFRALKRRQAQWQKLLNDDAERFFKAPDTEGLQVLQDWIITIANDHISCIDSDEDTGIIAPLTRFRRHWESVVSPAFLDNTANREMETLETGYIETAISLIQLFAKLVFAIDMRPVVIEIFTSKWLDGYGMKRIISTFDDYWADYADVLHPSLRDVFTAELADALLVNYLGAVRNKGAKLKRSEAFVEKIRDDVSTAFEFFKSRTGSAAEFDAVRSKWRAANLLTKLLTAEKAAVPDVFDEFRAEFWDVQVGWVEAALRARDDFERNMASAVKQRAAAGEVERGADTVMSRVK